MNDQPSHPKNTGLPSLPTRAADSHKGTFGTVLIVGGRAGSTGDSRMIGAPALAATAALRAGAGLVKMLVPEPIAASALEICPSATAVPLPIDDRGELVPHAAAEILDEHLHSASAMVVGPGLGLSDAVEQLVYRVARTESCPVVLDADALNALAAMKLRGDDLLAPAVLTPHPGEFARLAESLKITHCPTDPETRPEACAQLAQILGCVVVLKGAGTLVSDGLRAWTCDRGHPCLATGGTGDVLAGLIGGLAAQHLATRGAARGTGVAAGLDLFECAQLSVEAHARAGETWARDHAASAGLLALELAGLLPGELERFRAQG